MKTKPTKFVDRVAAAFGFSRMIDAVNHRSEERGWVYAQAQDSKVDLSSYDRTRLMALSRKCFYNNAIVRGAVRDKAMYSVGSGIGIRPQAMSGDQAWDDAAEQWWENWARSPEISGRHDMRSLQMLVSEAIDRDGEIFAVLTAKSDGAPAVQIVESHRIESPDTAAGNAGVVDGVKLDKFQRPLGYFIGEGDEYPRRHREIKADVMLHVYEPERSDQVRGYPAIGVALNSVLDRDELLRFEMMAAKAGSSIGLVIKNATGNIGAEGFLGDFSKDSNGNLTRESIFGGGLVPRMKNSEDIQSFVMNRPNEKLDKHLEQYIRAAAIGLGLPYEFVWDTSAIGGVAQRFIIQKAGRCFAARQDVLVNAFLSKLWRYAIARAISRRELPMVANWQQVGWQTPRSITVDVGREATARRDDVKAGLMTLSDYFGEQGIDWKEAVAEIAAEREFAADLGVMIGVEQAQPQEEMIPDIAQPEVVMPAAEFSQLIAKLDCGTGAGGFKPNNDCAKSGGNTAPKKSQGLFLGKDQRKELADEGLVLHGTSAIFDDFKKGGHGAIYFSDPAYRIDEATQAEHIASGPFGGNLYAVKLDESKLKAFDPYNDTKAHEILKSVTGKDSKVIDYTDMPEIVSKAEKFGYNKYRVREPAVQGYSIAITDPEAATIVKRWKSGEKMQVSEFSARARKKKRIYKRKKPEAKPAP